MNGKFGILRGIHTNLTWDNPETPEEKMRHFIKERVGETLTHDKFHFQLDMIGYKNDSKKGRLKSINSILCEDGIKLNTTRKRINGERVTMVEIRENSIINHTTEEFEFTSPDQIYH